MLNINRILYATDFSTSSGRTPGRRARELGIAVSAASGDRVCACDLGSCLIKVRIRPKS
jgi:hypothetical protein